MVAMPLPTAVTTPSAFTEATVPSLDDQVTCGFGIVVPPASRTIALNFPVRPSAMMVSVEGDSWMIAADWATLISTVAETLPDRTVIFVAPKPLDLTTPCAVTVTTDASPLVQVNVTPDITRPFWSYTTAVNC